MKIIIDLPEKLIDEIRSLIDAGRYSNLNSFFHMASDNQLELEKAPANGDRLTSEPIGTKVEMTNLESHTPYIRTSQAPRFLSKSHEAELLQYLSINGDLLSSWSPIELSECNPALGDGEFLWGQVNRLFPCKVGLRVLAHLNTSYGTMVDLDTFRSKAAEVAATLGEIISEKDKAAGRKRDKAYAAGLPSGKRGKHNYEKSLERFKNQFLAYVRKDKKVDGALARLKLVGVYAHEDGKAEIGFTPAGLEFTKLPNPFLDKTGEQSSLSQAEIGFYIDHVRRNVHAEAEAMGLLLTLITKGVVKREELNEKLRKHWNNDWSPKIVNTQRNGLTARMLELGLLAKRKSGLEVTYLVTNMGEEFLAKVEL